MMKKYYILIVFSALLFHYLCNGVEAVECDKEPKNDEGRLRKQLFCGGYDKESRPITIKGPITIKFKMIIKGFNFDDNSGKLTVSTWLGMTWNDDHLHWQPRDFNNIESITQSSQTIWQPDLALFNTDVASAQEEFCRDANCVIQNTGIVSCIPPCSHSAKCSPTYDRWPFDQQNCTLHIGTWVNSGEEVDFKVLKSVLTEDDLSSQNLEWRMIRATYKRNPGNFSETKQTYPSLTFSFLIERHSASHAASILVPAISLVLVNLISLWVDSTNNQRTTLLSLGFVGHLLYMQHLFWALPHNGDTMPDLLAFFRDSFLITVALIINTIIVQGMQSFDVQTPDWVSNTTTFMRSNRVGKLFLTKHLVTSNFSVHHDENEDDINLVEAQGNDREATKNPIKTWRIFGNIIDRVLFAFLSILYLIMVIGLLPEKFLDSKSVNSVEIIGY